MGQTLDNRRLQPRRYRPGKAAKSSLQSSTTIKTGDGSDNIGPVGFKYKTVPHVTLGGIAQNVALNPIFAEWEPILDEKLGALNDALSGVTYDVRANLLAKLESKRKKEGKRAVTDADERRWRLPKDRWEHWQVPFDADPDYPDALCESLEAYRVAWRGKMDEVNACIAANADQEGLVDQPEVRKGVVRVSGPFTVEAVHPPEQSLDAESPIGGAPAGLRPLRGTTPSTPTARPTQRPSSTR